VKLTLKTTNQDTDYVNANFIKVKKSCWESFALLFDTLIPALEIFLWYEGLHVTHRNIQCGHKVASQNIYKYICKNGSSAELPLLFDTLITVLGKCTRHKVLHESQEHPVWR